MARRAFASLELYLDCFLQGISTSFDHCPLLLSTYATLTSKRCFHFESFWPKQEGYLEVVQQAWCCPDGIIDLIQRVDFMLPTTARELQPKEVWEHQNAASCGQGYHLSIR